MSEVTRAAAHRDHEVIIFERLLAQSDLARGQTNLTRFIQKHRDVLASGKNRANGLRNVRRRQTRRRDLIEQRLEQMMIVAIHQRDARVRVMKVLAESKSAESP